MKIGLAAIGIGNGARGDVLQATAASADEAGFSTLWAGEHVVLVEHQEPSYPYAEDGRLAVAPHADWLDPLAALGAAAAVTRSVRLATGILLLPEHNPVITAKRAASLDSLSGGRLALGVGAGWSAEEYAAVGVPFEGRTERMADYVAAMRRLWEDDISTYHGDFADFEAVRCYPKPAGDRRIPVLVGGNTRAALSRAVAYGDGWYGFNLGVEEASRRTRVLRELSEAAGRDPDGLEVVVAPFTNPVSPGDLASYAGCGVDEVVLVAEPPADPEEAREWVTGLADRWVPATRSTGPS